MADPQFGQQFSNHFGLADIGSSSKPAFVDIDHDGDLDAFVGRSDGLIRYFVNSGTVSAPSFANTGSNNFSLHNQGPFAALAFVDIDDDGDQDALLGLGVGTTLFFQNIGTSSAPLFSKLGGLSGLGSAGSYAVPAFGDIDGDGDFDAFIGGGDGATRFFRNTGTASVPAFASESETFGLGDVGDRAAPTLVDFDQDGLLDLAVGNATGQIAFFHNAGGATAPQFVAVTSSFGLTDTGGQAAPTFADLDHDGDRDLFTGTASGNIVFQLNGGDAPITFTPVRGAVAVTEGQATDAYSVVLNVQPTSDVTIRLLLDGQLSNPNVQLTFTPLNWDVAQQVKVVAVNDKVFEGAHSSIIEHTVNSNDPLFAGAAPGPITVSITDNDLLPGEPGFGAGVSNAFGLAQVGYLAHPSFADIDGDGDFDAFIGDYAGTTTFFENTGTFSAPAFSLQSDNFGLGAVDSRAAPSFVDIDGDDDLDAVIGSGDGQLTFFRNVGSGSAPAFASESGKFGLAAVDGYATPTFADIDADGDPDAFVGSKSGETFTFRNTGSRTAPAFATPGANTFGIGDVGKDSVPALADLDGDGDLDLTLTDYFGAVGLLRNTVRVDSPGFTPEPTNLGLDAPGNHAFPTFVDIDGDGDIDAFVGNNYGDTWFYANTRSANSRPMLGNVAKLTYKDTPAQDKFATFSGVLTATDANGDALTFGVLGGTDNGDTVTLDNGYGTLTVTKATGAYTFVPDNYAMEALGSATSDDFLVTVSDGVLSSSHTLPLEISQSGKTETTGNDKLVGTAGNNTFIPLGGTDTIDGLAGMDTVSFDWATGAVTFNLALTTAQKTGGGGTVSVRNVENLTGSGFDDRLTGNAGANVLNGGAGKDTMTGAAGSDTYYVDNTGDVVKEEASGGTADKVISALGTYTLPATIENGQISNPGAANLTGNAAANVLGGGRGVNKLTGGGGKDVFDFNVLAESGTTPLTRDTLADFSHAQGDLIDLSGLDANAAVSGNQAFTRLTSSAAAFNPAKTFTAVGQLYFDQAAHVLYANTLAGTEPEFSLKVLGTAVLVTGDFIL